MKQYDKKYGLITSSRIFLERRFAYHPGQIIRRFAVWSRLSALAPKEGIVFDIGCGRGITLSFLARRKPSAKLYGLDLDAEEIEYARKICAPYPNVTLKIGDITQYDLPRNLDLILCIDTLEHLPEPFAVIGKFSRSLKPGGYLLLHTPHIPTKYFLKNEHPRWEDPGHCIDGFTRSELEGNLSSFGLQIIEVAYTFGPVGAFAWELPLVLFQSLPLKLVQLLLFPLTILLCLLDKVHNNRLGNGILIVGRK